MRAEQPQKMFHVAAKRVSIAAHENVTPLFSFLFAVNIYDPTLIEFFWSCAAQPYQPFLECSNCSSLWNANGLRITEESRKMQTSPRMDVDEAPYASNVPGTDLLNVTELEDAHDSIELLNSDDNPGSFYTEALPISDSDETSGQCKKSCLRGTYSAQRIAGIIMCQFLKSTFFSARIEIALSSTAQAVGTGWT